MANQHTDYDESTLGRGTARQFYSFYLPAYICMVTNNSIFNTIACARNTGTIKHILKLSTPNITEVFGAEKTWRT